MLNETVFLCSSARQKYMEISSAHVLEIFTIFAGYGLYFLLLKVELIVRDVS